jgi:hypothetical protein
VPNTYPEARETKPRLSSRVRYTYPEARETKPRLSTLALLPYHRPALAYPEPRYSSIPSSLALLPYHRPPLAFQVMPDRKTYRLGLASRQFPPYLQATLAFLLVPAREILAFQARAAKNGRTSTPASKSTLPGQLDFCELGFYAIGGAPSAHVGERAYHISALGLLDFSEPSVRTPERAPPAHGGGHDHSLCAHGLLAG